MSRKVQNTTDDPRSKKGVTFTENNTPDITKSTASLVSHGRKPACGLLQFATLKILFIDLVVAFGDTGADFAQAYFLCTHPDEQLRCLVMAIRVVEISNRGFKI